MEVRGLLSWWDGDDPSPETEYVHSSRIEDCEPMRMASLHVLDCFRLRPNQFGNKLGWRETKPSQKQGIRLNV